MGGYGVSVELVDGPTDREVLDKLHREVWAVVVRRLLTLVTDPAGVSILENYMYAWVDGDLVGGFESDWVATPRHLSFSFGDAGGLCWGEMYASLHWTELVLLEQWPAVEAVVAAHGARARPSGQRILTLKTLAADGMVGTAAIALDDSLTGRAEQIFFPYGNGLAYVSFYEHDGGWFFNRIPIESDNETEGEQDEEGDVSLDALPEPDRSRITALVEAGRCDCQPCRTLRAARGLDQ